MATWIAHLRIAEKLLRKYDLMEESFLVGNIAPDSGVPNSDWSAFDPPKQVTHWMDTTKDLHTIKSEDFFNKYIDIPNIREDKKRYSFLLGYYFHLLSDIEWDKMHKAKIKNNPALEKRLKEESKFIWEVKKDWYGLDFLHLRENNSSIFFSSFMKIKSVKDYLDYFPNGAFTRQVKYITDFYLENIAKEDDKREFIYLSKNEMDEFVNRITEIIEKTVVEKKLII